METLEVGKFVRTEKGEIFKINNYNEQKDNPLWMTINSKLYMKGTIIKASHNIIDLIEVGDYVNGYRVVSKGTLSSESKKLYLAILTNDYGNFWSDKIFEQDIKTIVTKEQFENNCYKIEN